jgi:hypothetical protein
MRHLPKSSAYRRPAIIVSLLLAMAVATTGAASAAPPDAAVQSAASLAAVEPAGIAPASFGSRTIVLGPKATKKLLAALAAFGVGGAITMCGFLVPSDIKPYCGLIVSTLAAMGSIGDAGEKCLSVTLTFGVPPVRVSLVPCPVTPVPELVPDVPLVPQVGPVVL